VSASAAANALIADSIAALGSMDFVLGDTDRYQHDFFA
jgi:NADH:ubiquinone oxidoreductase subunit D